MLPDWPDLKKLVGVPRFELGTPCTPYKCATGLRCNPTVRRMKQSAAPKMANIQCEPAGTALRRRTGRESLRRRATMSEATRLNALGRFRRYAGHDDPRTAVANLVALMVASNQPFYPLYLYWAVSPTVWPAFATFLSTPFFLAVPALSRRNPLLGRTSLLAAGLGNTLICRFMFGASSGVDAFLMPCIMLSILLFRRCERAISFALAAACYAIYLLPDAWLGAPVHRYDLSAAGLTAVVALMFANAFEGEPATGTDHRSAA
jgi:hypothetical protein